MIETRSPLNGPGATADMGKAVHRMGSFEIRRSTRRVMPGADEGTGPALFQVEINSHRREADGNLRAGDARPDRKAMQ